MMQCTHMYIYDLNHTYVYNMKVVSYTKWRVNKKNFVLCCQRFYCDWHAKWNAAIATEVTTWPFEFNKTFIKYCQFIFSDWKLIEIKIKLERGFFVWLNWVLIVGNCCFGKVSNEFNWIVMNGAIICVFLKDIFICWVASKCKN